MLFTSTVVPSLLVIVTFVSENSLEIVLRITPDGRQWMPAVLFTVILRSSIWMAPYFTVLV
jgi:hypothetical protein